MSILIETSLGNIVVDLFVDECPKLCENFLKLCKVKYYNFHLFHKVESGFIAQTGDPTGTGSGGESIYALLADGQPPSTKQKFFSVPVNSQTMLKHKRRGTLSMACIPPASTSSSSTSDSQVSRLLVGSQFFLTLGDDLDQLDGRHLPFGEVAEGEEILGKLDAAYVDQDGRPYQDIRIKHTVILFDPFDDPPGLVEPDRSPEPTKELLESGRLAVDEKIFDDEPEEVIEKRLKVKEAKARELTLEMIGDLPYADIKPPEHVLFVCKLNPVTRDEDLELIFSRFGKINSCEVIRDKLTGDSLCYAFIEFDEKAACEEAYFKMQNVLIDDRRIHVDFSQSVSKLHKSWISDRTAAGRGIGGFEGVEKRTKYRAGHEIETGKKYDMIFEEEEKEGRESMTKKDERRRDRSVDRHGRDRRDHDRHSEDRSRRDRSRDKERSYRSRGDEESRSGRDGGRRYDEKRYDRRSRSPRRDYRR